MTDSPVHKKITISNPNDRPVTIQLGEIDYPFQMKLPDGSSSTFVIKGKEKRYVVVTFKTSNPGSWSCQIPIWLTNDSILIHYNDLILTGMCHPSTIYCSTPEVSAFY